MRSGEVIREMISFFGTSKNYIAHALKVYAYASALAELENQHGEKFEAVVYAAILHDVGIKIACEKYGSCSDRQQEEEGPPLAEKILMTLGINKNIVDRVCFLIAHHHTPETSEEIDFRILLEADYFVNLEEGNIPITMKDEVFEKHFRTEFGKTLFKMMFR